MVRGTETGAANRTEIYQAFRIAAGCAWLAVQFMACASRGLRLHGARPGIQEEGDELSTKRWSERLKPAALRRASQSKRKRRRRSSGSACCGSQLRAGDRRRHDMCASRDGPALRRATPCRRHRTHGAHAAQLQKW